MEYIQKSKEEINIFKFSENKLYTPDTFTKKLKHYVKKLKSVTKSDKINFLSETIGVSLGLNSMQDKKIKKELTRLQEIYRLFSEPDNKLTDLNLIMEEKFKKCEKHQKRKYFFCDDHRETSLMCNNCCEDHILDKNQKISQKDIDKHSLYYFPSFIIKQFEDQMIDLNIIRKTKAKVTTVCDAIINKKKYLDYNYYYIKRIIDNKFNELSQFLLEYKKEIKKTLSDKYKKYKNETDYNDLDWFKAKETINDEFYNYYNTVINKISNFQMNFDNLIKNSEEKIKRDNIENKFDFKGLLVKFNQKSIKQPLFNCAFIDLEKIKKSIQENIYLFEQQLRTREIKTVKDNLVNDEQFSSKQKKITLFLDNKYTIRVSNLLKSKFKKQTNNVIMITKNNEPIDDFENTMVFPINSSKLYLDGNDLIRECDPKIILIGGVYLTKKGKISNNYFSVFDNNSNSLHLNYYNLNYFDNNKLKKYNRIGVKVLLINKDEIKKNELNDYYNLLLFGGDTLEGASTNSVFLMKGINHILSGKVNKDNKLDHILEPIHQISIVNKYFEILKYNSFVYFFGGIDPNTGDVTDSIHVINLLDFNFKKEFKMPKRLFAFSFSISPSRGNYLLIGGLASNDSSNLLKNEVIYELTIKDNNSVFFSEIGKLTRKRIRPTINIDNDKILIMGGSSESLIEVFSMSDSKIIQETNSSEFFDKNPIVKQSQLASFIVRD